MHATIAKPESVASSNQATPAQVPTSLDSDESGTQASRVQNASWILHQHSGSDDSHLHHRSAPLYTEEGDDPPRDPVLELPPTPKARSTTFPRPFSEQSTEGISPNKAEVDSRYVDDTRIYANQDVIRHQTTGSRVTTTVTLKLSSDEGSPNKSPEVPKMRKTGVKLRTNPLSDDDADAGDNVFTANTLSGVDTPLTPYSPIPPTHISTSNSFTRNVRQSLSKMTAWHASKLQPSPDIQSPSGESFGSVRKGLSTECISAPKGYVLTGSVRTTDVEKQAILENGQQVTEPRVKGKLLLSGPQLSFFKSQKNPFGMKSTHQKTPSFELSIKYLTVCRSDTHSETLEIKWDNTEGKTACYNIYFTSQAAEWAYAIDWSQKLLNTNQLSTAYVTRSPPSVDNAVITMLLEFFRRRPNKEYLEKKGILRLDPIFGGELQEICDNEKSEVPSFVERAIHAIEARGLRMVGLYRISGNELTIQKLRNQVNQRKYSLQSDAWNLQVLAGALKLFFRELRTPLFPFNETAELFKELRRVSECQERDFTRTWQLLSSLPQVNINTSRCLFHHLHEVSKFYQDNQMEARSLAIVVTPSLTWPTSAATNYLVDRVPAIYCLIVNCKQIFNQDKINNVQLMESPVNT